jgi:hypothetical protein
VAVPLRNPGITRTLGLLSRKDVLLSPLAETLRACVRRYFRDLSVMAAPEHGPRIVRCSKFTAPVKQVI